MTITSHHARDNGHIMVRSSLASPDGFAVATLSSMHLPVKVVILCSVWTDPGYLHVSSVDPIGGPTSGDTIIQVLGQGFQPLGGAIMHGSAAFNANASDAHRPIDAGVFCKFSSDAATASPGRKQECVTDDGNVDALGNPDEYPAEGQASAIRAASSRHLRHFSCFTKSSTPSLGAISSVVQATYVNPGLMICRSPPFNGVLTLNKATFRVHVALNGHFNDMAYLSNSNVTYSVYGE